jgi:hypothetical protein
MARGQGRGRSVGSSRGRRLDTRQVFDARSAHRARSGEADKNNTKLEACLGRINYT